MTETQLNVCMSKYMHVVYENSPVPTGLKILKITNITFTGNSLCTLYVPLKKHQFTLSLCMKTRIHNCRYALYRLYTIIYIMHICVVRLYRLLSLRSFRR